MDVIEAHAARLPATDERWIPRPRVRAKLEAALVEGHVAGVVSHPLDNVCDHLRKLLRGDEDKQFGMSGLDRLGEARALELIEEAAGFPLDLRAHSGPVRVDPARVLDDCLVVGGRLARACERGERVVLATGHPVGLILLYMEVARLLVARGAKVSRPAEGLTWRAGDRHHVFQLRYLEGVAILTDKASARHTHDADPMVRMLAEGRPDLVFADHGFAGAAIEAGVETVSIADVNDPALIVAKALGRTEYVVVMDDNVAPDAYWPCFQAIAQALS